MELEEFQTQFVLQRDNRPRMPEPLPVRLVAVEDVRLVSAAGLENELDAFYVTMLKFERQEQAEVEQIIYRADNVRLIFEIVESPVERDMLRPTLIEVLSLPLAEQQLIDLKIDYTRQRGVSLGRFGLLLLDPAGNWVELIERKLVQ